MRVIFRLPFWDAAGGLRGCGARQDARSGEWCLQCFRLPWDMRQPEIGLSGLLGFGHHPAYAAYVFNMLFADFLAQAVNQKIDGVAFHFFAPAVDFVFQLAAG